MRVLLSYNFWVVASGSAPLAAIAMMIGRFSVYRGQGLISDALRHASYPDVVPSFMLFRIRNSSILCPGVAASAAVSYALVLWLQGKKKLAPGAVLAAALAGMFDLGVVLKTFTQDDPASRSAPQSGLRVYILGSAAFMTKRDVWLLLLGALLLIGLLYFSRQPLQYSGFDPGYVVSLNIPERLMDIVILRLIVAIIALGIRTVSVVLISVSLLLPCVVASQCVKVLPAVLRFVMAVAVRSALLGRAVSASAVEVSTGSMIIVCMGAFTLAVFLLRLGKEKG